MTIDFAPKVFIIILNWNGLSDTLSCLTSIYLSNYQNFSVLVIDNHSINDELITIKQKFPNIIGFQLPQNYGYTGGCNIGIKHALDNGGEFVWLLNNDSVVNENTLQELVNKMKNDPMIGLSSPIILDSAFDKIMNCGVSFDLNTLERYSINDLKSYQTFLTNNTLGLCLWGTALFINCELIKKIGFLDDNFFAYHEDIDYSLRSLNNGWTNTITTTSYIAHGELNRERRKSYYFFMSRNELLLIYKYSSIKNIKINIRLYFYKTFLRASRNFSREQENSKLILDGFWNAINNRFGEWDLEKRIPSLLEKLIYIFPRVTSYLFWFLYRKRLIDNSHFFKNNNSSHPTK